MTAASVVALFLLLNALVTVKSNITWVWFRGRQNMGHQIPTAFEASKQQLSRLPEAAEVPWEEIYGPRHRLNEENDEWKRIEGLPADFEAYAPTRKYNERRLRPNSRPDHKVVTRDDYDFQAIRAGRYKMSNRSFPVIPGRRTDYSDHPNFDFTPSIYDSVASTGLVDCWMPSLGLEDETVHCTAFRKDSTVMFNQTVSYPDLVYFLYAEAIPNGLVLVTRKSHCSGEECLVVRVDAITRRVLLDPIIGFPRMGAVRIRRAEHRTECLWDLRQRDWEYSVTVRAEPDDDFVELLYYCDENTSFSRHALRVDVA